MTSKILSRRTASFARCPSCKQNNVLRRSSSRSSVEHFINHTTFFKTFRCKSCGWRGYLSTLGFTIHSLRTFLYYIFIGLIAALIVRYFLKFLV